MPNIWDLLPASAWPVQPFVGPLDPMQPPPGRRTVSPQASASSAPAFGWAPPPAAAASAPAFGWASASPAPPNAPADSGAIDPHAFLGAFPHADVDPARTARLAEDARRAYDFALWAFGPPSRPAGQTRELAAGPEASASRFAPTAAAADVVDAPPRSGAMSGIDDAGNRPASADVPVPANWADQWDAPVGTADAAPVGAVSDPRAPMLAPRDHDPIAAPPPARPSAQARYRRAQAGDESFAPQFVRTGPTYPEAVIDGMADAGRIMTTPPPRIPDGYAEDDGGRIVKVINGRFVPWEQIDPDAAYAYRDEMQKRAELPMRIALGMLGGGAGFAERGALGAGGGALRQPALAMDEASRMARAREMGFYADMPLAHGSAAEFDAFKSAKFGSTTGAAPARLGVWTEVRQGQSTPIADRFARIAAESTGGNPQVYPLIHRAANPAQLTLRGDEMRHEIAATLADAWDRGHDAVLLRNFSTHGGAPGNILVVKDPSQLRSPFAAFDPARRDSANLLAGLAGLAAIPTAAISALPLPRQDPPVFAK